jgi:hypothetical protein
MGKSWVQILHQTPELAHLVEQWSIKPSVTGSNPVLKQSPALGMGISLPTSPSGTGEIPRWFESSILLLCCAGVLQNSVALGNGVPQQIVGQCDRLNPSPRVDCCFDKIWMALRSRWSL